jgi:flagellar hook-associated protein 1 FlgK
MGTAIDNALSGLVASQARIDVVSRNITNASVEGYTEKTQQVATDPTGGLRLLGISRQVDQALQATSRDSGASIGSLNAQIDALSQLEAQFGQPGDGTTLADQIANLKSSFQTLSVNPNDSTAQQTVVANAQAVSRTFNSLNTAAQNIETDLTTKLGAQVTQANSLLQNMAQLNDQIVATKAANGDTTDLEDQRDQALQQLGGILGVTAYADGAGRLAVYTKSGQELLGSDANTLTVDPVTSAVEIQNNAGTATPLSVTTGAIGGMLQARDVAMPAFTGRLDQLAAALTTGMKTAGVELFNEGGSTSFVAADTAGYSATIAVNAAVVGTPALTRDTTGASSSGDTTIIGQVLSFFDQTPAPGLNSSIGVAATSLVADYSTQRAALQTQVDQETGVKQSIDKRLADETGVNVDQEFAQMVQLQQSYAANAKVLETVKQMFDTLLSTIQ